MPLVGHTSEFWDKYHNYLTVKDYDVAISFEPVDEIDPIDIIEDAIESGKSFSDTDLQRAVDELRELRKERRLVNKIVDIQDARNMHLVRQRDKVAKELHKIRSRWLAESQLVDWQNLPTCKEDEDYAYALQRILNDLDELKQVISPPMKAKLKEEEQ